MSFLRVACWNECGRLPRDHGLLAYGYTTEENVSFPPSATANCFLQGKEKLPEALIPALIINHRSWGRVEFGGIIYTESSSSIQ